ncbi:hypothetical protein OsJ_08250 [Oryza sativa Japonica Group]|uniref:Uncharacterized protein n=1 Tax=Oryza sativa subsp. japonica TaxID=39947 RepID=B9F2I4_ORYSJ|nr:hypothetical protein OsJ_08250 [Oryza sativa Japonica Group]
MALRDPHSRLSPCPRPANGDPGWHRVLQLKAVLPQLELRLAASAVEGPSRTGHGVTSASASLLVHARLRRLRGHARLRQRRRASAVVVVRLGVEPRHRRLRGHAQLLCCRRCDLARLAAAAATCNSAGRARLRRLPAQARHAKPLHA